MQLGFGSDRSFKIFTSQLVIWLIGFIFGVSVDANELSQEKPLWDQANKVICSLQKRVTCSHSIPESRLDTCDEIPNYPYSVFEISFVESIRTWSGNPKLTGNILGRDFSLKYSADGMESPWTTLWFDDFDSEILRLWVGHADPLGNFPGTASGGRLFLYGQVTSVHNHYQCRVVD